MTIPFMPFLLFYFFVSPGFLECMITIIMWFFTTPDYLLAMKNEEILNHTKRYCNYHIVFVSKRQKNRI